MSKISHVEIAKAIISKLEEARKEASHAISNRFDNPYCGSEEKKMLSDDLSRIRMSVDQARGFEPHEYGGLVFRSDRHLGGLSEEYFISGIKNGQAVRLIVNWRHFNACVRMLPADMQEELKDMFSYNFSQ